MSKIESVIRTYWTAKFPFLYYINSVIVVLVQIFWLFGIFLGIYFIKEQGTFAQIMWLFGWFFLGLVIFVLGFWYKIGRQIIRLDGNDILVTKKFGLLRYSKRIPKSKINSVSLKKYEPFNFITGGELKINKNLGWFVLNDAILTTIYGITVKNLSFSQRVGISLIGFLILAITLFKIQHWPGINILKLSLLIPVIYYLYSLIKAKFTKELSFMIFWLFMSILQLLELAQLQTIGLM